MRKRVFWKMPTTLAVFCLGFALALAGCDGTGSPAGNGDPAGSGGGGGGIGGGGGGGGQPAPVSVSITITGIPSGYQGSWGELVLRVPATMNEAGVASINAVGSTATFTLNAIPGTYHVFFSFGGGRRVMPSMEITGGSNTIPWAAFAPPLSITVTGIPSQYHSSSGSIELLFPGTGNRVGEAWTSISGGTTTFTVAGVTGLHEVHLRFGGGNDARIYRTSSITYLEESTTIPWAAFVVMPPLTITVTGIPSRFEGSLASLGLMTPGTMNFVGGDEAEITGSSATFTVRGAVAGTYDVLLAFIDEMAWFPLGVYSVSARNITANTTIPFSQFAVLPPSVTITITGIPERYHGDWGDLSLYTPGTGVYVGSAVVSSVTSSTTFAFWNAQPGTFDVVLWLNDFGVRYVLPSSRAITDEMSIPFGQFVLSPESHQQAFSAPLEHSGRALPDRAIRPAHGPFSERAVSGR